MALIQRGPFVVRSLGAHQAALHAALDVLDDCTYPWGEDFRDRMRAVSGKPGKNFVTVKFVRWNWPGFDADHDGDPDMSGKWDGHKAAISLRDYWGTPVDDAARYDLHAKNLAHELGHVADSYTLDWDKRRAILDLMRDADGNKPPGRTVHQQWFGGSTWRDRPFESFCYPWGQLYLPGHAAKSQNFRYRIPHADWPRLRAILEG